MARATLEHHARTDVPAAWVDLGGLLTRGAIAGFVAGVGFILANMWFAVANGKPPVAPFLAISTVFHGSSMPQPGPENVVAGLVTHTALSLGFGMGFAVLAVLAPPLLRNAAALTVAAAGYGLALYVLDFQILGRTVFPFFTNPKGPNQIFEVIIHPLIFGLLLVPFFLGWTDRNRQPGG